MINKTKTKILTLSVASVVGLAAITVLASNANNALDFQGEVKQNAHLELKELKLIENPTKPGVTSKTDVTWKMDDNELVATKEAKGTTNTVKGEWTLSIWGQSNSITESESFILWGTKNALGAKTSIIGASNRVKITEWEGNVVLSSSNWTVKGTGNIILSSNPYFSNRVNGSGNIALSVEWSRIKSNGSMAIGKNIQIENEWTFVFNAKEASAPFKSKNDYTTLIFANNGMIINTNKRNTPNVGLTVNWGIKVGQITNLDQQWSLITQDNCLQLKSTEKGAISLKCRGIERDVEEALKTPKCWRNAANYHYTDSRWKGAENSDFCAQGTFEGDKSFRSEEQRTTPTGIWSYADKGFTYDFTICFRDKDPLCAPKNLSKTWRCKTPEGNAVVCEANLQIKPMQCGANQHLEDEGQTNGTTAQGRKCLPNQKTVPCDDKGINKANGSFTNENVSVTRDANNRTYTTPSKCTLKCNEGFKLNEAKTACMSSTKQVACDETFVQKENGRLTNPLVHVTHLHGDSYSNPEECNLECNSGYDKITSTTQVQRNRNWNLVWWYMKSCKQKNYRCTGPVPENAKLVPGDDQWLNQNTQRVLVENDSSAKCEYICDDNSETKIKTRIVKGHRKKVGISCIPRCNSNEHREAESCVSNTKTVDCDAIGINKNNGSIAESKVTITWSNGKWSSPEKCQLTCNTGYELKKEWDNRYCAEKKTKTYQCIGDVPKFSSLILNDDKDLKWDTKISLVERGWNTASKCEYQCNKWYFKVWNRCEKTCYATMARDGVSEKHYRNYKPFEYYVPHRFIKWNSYNPYALAAIKSDFFKILDLGNFPTENIGSSLYYKVPNRLKYANATKFTSLNRDSNENTALFIKDTTCSTEGCDYLYVRPRDDVIEKGVTDLSSLYSEGHYTYVSVEEAKNGFFTSPWWNHRDRSGNLWSALCFFDQTVTSGGSCSPSVGYAWWPHSANAPYSCSDVYPKDEYGKCWGTMTQNGEPCSEMKTKDACNKHERQNNSMYYCKWNEK